MSNFWSKKIKELEKKSNSSSQNAIAPTPANFWQQKIDELEAKENELDIAPVETTVKNTKQEEKKGLFDGITAPLDDGWDFGDITSIILEGVDRVDKAVFGKKNEDKDGDGLRDASWWDATVKSAKRGYYNSLYGEETFASMMGEKNSADAYRKILEGDELTLFSRKSPIS